MEHDFEPEPRRGKGTWSEFLKIHTDTLWHVDFFSKWIWIPYGHNSQPNSKFRGNLYFESCDQVALAARLPLSGMLESMLENTDDALPASAYEVISAQVEDIQRSTQPHLLLMAGGISMMPDLTDTMPGSG